MQRFARRGLRMPEVNRRQALVIRGRRGPRESEWDRARADGRRRPPARRPPAGTSARVDADDGRARRGPARRAGGAGAVVSSDPLHRRPGGIARRGARAADLFDVAARHSADRDDDPRGARTDRTAFRHAIGRRRGGAPCARAGKRRDGRRARARRLQHGRPPHGGDRRATSPRPEAVDLGRRVVHGRPVAVAPDRHPRKLGVRAGRSRVVQQRAQSGTGVRPAGADRGARGGERAGRGRARRRRSITDRRVDRRRDHRHRRAVGRNSAEAGRHRGDRCRQRRSGDAHPDVLSHSGLER